MGRLDGKVAIISGAARGQGLAEARRFVAEGACVVMGDVLDADVREAAAAIDAGAPGRAEAIALDVTDERSWAAAVELAVSRYGGLHILVNNAGITNERFGGLKAIEDMTLEMWDTLVRVNLTGAFLGTRAAIPALRQTIRPLRERDERATGSIVNIASAQAKRPSAFQANYAAAKWGLRGLTRVAAVELAPEIRVNSVLPGAVRTPMTEVMLDTNLSVLRALVDDTPLRRIGTPDEVANMVLFLASDEASYCTGAEFMVEGGRTAAVTKPD